MYSPKTQTTAVVNKIKNINHRKGKPYHQVLKINQAD